MADNSFHAMAAPHLFIRSSDYGLFGRFYFPGQVEKNATAYSCTRFCVAIYFQVSWACSVVELLIHGVPLCLMFWGTSIFQKTTILHSHHQCMNVLILYILANSCICLSFFALGHLSGWKWYFIVVFMCISRMVSVLSIFMGLLKACISSLETCWFRSSCPYSNWDVFLLLLSEFWHRLKFNPSPDFIKIYVYLSPTFYCHLSLSW